MHGTRLAERGAPPAMIKMALGHKCLAATLRYIDHAPSSFSVRAAFLLSGPPPVDLTGGQTAQEQAVRAPSEPTALAGG